MKYFSALADASFARAAFTAAGLDFDAAITAKNTDVLKTALAAAKPAVDAEQILKDAATENEELKTKVAALEKNKVAADSFVSLSSACESIGIKAVAADGKLMSAADFTAAHKALVAKSARDLVAAAGHPGVLETPAPSAEEKNKPKTEGLTGRDRMKADFDAQIRNLNLPSRRQN